MAWFLSSLTNAARAAYTSFSTGKKRKRDAAADKHAQEAECAHAMSETSGAVNRRLRFSSAPELAQEHTLSLHAPHGYTLQHAEQSHAPQALQQQPTLTPFTCHPHPAPPSHTAHTAHAPPPTSSGLHDRFRSLKLDHNLSRSSHPAHAELGHSLGHGPLPSHSYPRQQAAPSAQQQQQHAVPHAATANHGTAVLPKQLHTDFNEAAHARPQGRGGATSLPGYTTSRPHPVSRVVGAGCGAVALP